MIRTKLVRQDDGWWIEGFPCGPVGPYDKQRSEELRDDRAGLQRWYARDEAVLMGEPKKKKRPKKQQQQLF